jgi:hypothetical protein
MTATIPATEILTPTLRTATRRSLFWILAGVFLVLVALASLALTGAARGAGTPYSATDASPAGSKAIAEVLRQRGVDVVVADSLAAAKRALAGHGPSTLLLADPNDYLSATQLRALAADSAHLVLPSPTYDGLNAVAPDIKLAGVVKRSTLTAGCDLRAATNAGTVTGTGEGLRVSPPVATVTAAAVRCFGSGDDVYSVVQTASTNHTVTVVGLSAAFSNEHAAEHGNAAFALSTLGDHDRLVWYLPTIGDAELDTHPTIAQLTPPWVSPVLVLLVITAIVAAVWRGRRFGPLIVENLPVVVRANETMEGRARLYQKSAARQRAIDAIRIGTISRLATICGMSRQASVEDVARTVAEATGRELGGIRAVLLDDVPTDDRALVQLSDALAELERSTAEAIRPTD